MPKMPRVKSHVNMLWTQLETVIIHLLEIRESGYGGQLDNLGGDKHLPGK